MDENVLRLLGEELGGEVSFYEEEAPGTYYLNIQTKDGLHQEYYLVLDEAPISQEARSMGRQVENIPALVYLIDSEESGRWAVKYEILKYKVLHNLQLSKWESLHEIALYGMEMCPEYFGEFPVPGVTPWGHTLRHRLLDSGIYYIETSQCEEVLAVCYPVWITELSNGILGIAEKMPHEGKRGGYLYFQRAACIAIFELLRTRSTLVASGLIRKPQLMNAIWKYYPEYAIGYNAQEQAGLNDGFGLLLYALGIEDRELVGSIEQMISISPEVGTDFIGFWK